MEPLLRRRASPPKVWHPPGEHRQCLGEFDSGQMRVQSVVDSAPEGGAVRMMSKRSGSA